MDSDCGKWSDEIVECARSGSQPGDALGEHLRQCSPCRERCEDELRLSEQFRALRDAARVRRPAETRRSRILTEFDAARPLRVRLWLKWSAAAAVLLVALGSAELLRSHRPPAAPTAAAAIAPTSGEFDGLPLDSSGFMAVPYAPPLAAGELVSVVRTELRPSALARMGIYIDPGYSADIPADLVIGDDGLPRAVRLVEAVEF